MILFSHAFTFASLSLLIPSVFTYAVPPYPIRPRATNTSASRPQPSIGLRLANGSVITQWGNDQNFGCSNLNQNLSTGCWDELDVPKYLNDWWADNGPVCQAMQVDFVSCYQQKLGLEQQACSTIGPDHCDYPINFIKDKYSPQEAYSLYTIFAIWQWFNSLYTAVGNADVTASGPVGSIVTLINPIKTKSKNLGDFLSAFTALAPMIAFPAAWGAWGLFKTSTIFEGILRQTPGVINIFHPVGTLDSQFTDFNNINSGLSTVKSTYQANVTQALKLVQSNITNFLSFAQHGAFIAPKSDLQAQTLNLTTSLLTFVIAQALKDSNIIIVMARDTNPLSFATNGSTIDPELLNCTGFDSYSTCGEWWFDNTTNISYGLSNVADPSKKYRDTLQKLFKNGWTTPENLFRNARDCADFVAAGGSSAPTLDEVHMQPRCISNTQVCVYNQGCAINDVNCLYTGEYGGQDPSSKKNGSALCKPPNKFLNRGCKGNGDGAFMDFYIPAAYLGPVLREANAGQIVCNS